MISKTRLENFNKKFDVVSVFIEHAGEILMLHRADHKPQGGTWCMPAGKVNPGEDTLDALLREVKEETGLKIYPKELRSLQSYYVRHDCYDIFYHKYHLTTKEKPIIKINPNEHKDYKWLTPADALKLNLIHDEDVVIKDYFNLASRFNGQLRDAILQNRLPKTTLLFLYKPNERKILLAMKKRRFGAGKWNGVGGKLNAGETVENAAIREAKEEIGVSIEKENLKQAAEINFNYHDMNEYSTKMYAFFVEKWEGEPVETEEMRPQWFNTDNLPFAEMWVDDPYWLPKVLTGKKIKADFYFNNRGGDLIDSKIEEVEKF